tara:strand:- start:184 stop:1152 length:969 start_codon:yes stop_codon:yes gene_type:complete
MDSLYFTNRCSIRVALGAREINNSVTETLRKKIKSMVEGKCIREGYVKPGSVEVVKKSMGSMMMNHFNGDILYNVEYNCDICDPKEGMILNCTVENINKMGIVAYSGDGALNVLIAKQHHLEDDNFNSIQENEEVYISVIGVRKEYGDNQISIIGKLVYDVVKTKPKSEPQPDNEVSVPGPVNVTPIRFNNKSKKYKTITMHNTDNEFIYKGIKYKTIEHAYQAQKSDDISYKRLFDPESESYIGDDGALAKKTGTKTNMKKLKVQMIVDWDDTHKNILEDITREYFKQNEMLMTLLKKTQPRILEYTNKDYAEILMFIRDQ